jgi:hypothetical protein
VNTIAGCCRLSTLSSLRARAPCVLNGKGWQHLAASLA